MALIFCASTDLGAPRQTSRILLPVLRWLIPDISATALNRAQLLVRKTGHALGYATIAFVLTVLYAATDEWHQTFTVSRQGSVADVALDATGAVAGLALLWLWDRRRCRPS